MPDKDVKNTTNDQKEPTQTQSTEPTSDDYKKQIEALKKEIEELKKQASSTKKADVLEPILSKLEAFEQKLSILERLEEERKRKEEEEILKSLSETERLKYELKRKEEQMEKLKKELEESFGKKAQELEAKLKAYEEEKARLMQAAAKARTLEAATRFGAYNPEQVYLLIKDFLVPGEDGEVYARVKDATGEYIQQPVEEFLKDFLSRPENKNLVKASAAVGEGATPAGAEGAPTNVSSNKQDSEVMKFFKSLPAERQAMIKQEAAMSGLPVEDVAYVYYVRHRKAQEYKQRHKR